MSGETVHANRGDPLNIDPGHIPGARHARQPRSFRPQLATLVSAPPEGDDWLHELKLDGYRLIGFLENGSVRFCSRNGNDWTARVPDLADALRHLPVERAMVDGELVSLRSDGTTDFQALQNALGSAKPNLTLYVFDLPFCSGYDLRRAQLLDRKALLERLVSHLEGDAIRYSDHVRGRGKEVLERACRLSVEGILSKKIDSSYVSQRSRTWLKVKCVKRQEFVVAGYTDPKGSRKHFGALVLGYFDASGALVYAGQVGTGFTDESLERIARLLERRARSDSPFDKQGPGLPKKGVHWVKPDLVAEVAFTQWTDDGRLRHPSFEGLRKDKVAREVRRETERDG